VRTRKYEEEGQLDETKGRINSGMHVQINILTSSLCFMRKSLKYTKLRIPLVMHRNETLTFTLRGQQRWKVIANKLPWIWTNRELRKVHNNEGAE
jgi:hypothetical protein